MKEKIRIAYLVRPAEGGIKVHLLTLLSGLDRSRFDPVVICPPTITLFEEVQKKGISSIPLDIVGEINPLNDFLAIAKLRHVLRELKPDILHMHSFKAGLIGRLAALSLAKRPKLILTEHAFIFDERTTGLKRTLVTGVGRILSYFTDRIITVSDALRNELISEQKIKPSKIVTIPNGIAFAPLKQVPKPGLLVGTVSRLAPQKGVAYFIRAAVLISERFPQARFIIVGDGPQRNSLESLAESLGIKDKLEFLGFRTDVLDILRTFSVFVLASTRESFGLTLIEALSQGVPVVASRTGGIIEIVEDGVTGLLAEPGNHFEIAEQVCRLLEDRNLACRLAEEGSRLVRQRFSSEIMIEKTQKLYMELL
ncbi:MAG: glycosyltransferase family 4 protein [Armatimonadota bacterium]|nr:glycosyltransferase family 4 protein [Armatimonadota bacterium]